MEWSKCVDITSFFIDLVHLTTLHLYAMYIKLTLQTYNPDIPTVIKSLKNEDLISSVTNI